MPSDCTWTAIHDHMPGANMRLQVSGECLCPTPGYTLTLTRGAPQGINPKDLLLDLTEEAPSGAQPSVMTSCTADYTEEPAEEFDTVTVRGEGGETITVQHVD